jgi:hypothetical protein
MADAFYITMQNGAQAAADAFGVDLLFKSAPKFDPERQVSVLNADSFHQVECTVDRMGKLFGEDYQKERRGWLIFGCDILFIGI